MEIVLRVAQSIAELSFWVFLVLTGIALLIYIARHEEFSSFMSEKYAFEAKRSPVILKFAGAFIALTILSYGLSDVAEPFRETVYKERVITKTKIKKVPGPERVVKKEVEPDLVDKWEQCLINKEAHRYRDPTPVFNICRKYVANIKELSILDKANVITVYRKLPYTKYYDNCMASMTASDQSRSKDAEFCIDQAAKKLKGLVQNAENRKTN